MKVSQVSLLVACICGVVVVWSAVTPVAAGANSIIGGGWEPTYGCMPCSEPDHPEPCTGWWGCTSGGYMGVCVGDDGGSGQCGPDMSTGTPCRGNYECSSTWNGHCFGL